MGKIRSAGNHPKGMVCPKTSLPRSVLVTFSKYRMFWVFFFTEVEAKYSWFVMIWDQLRIQFIANPSLLLANHWMLKEKEWLMKAVPRHCTEPWTLPTTKPSWHMQTKLPKVFLQVCLGGHTAAPRWHSSTSGTQQKTCSDPDRDECFAGAQGSRVLNVTVPLPWTYN